LDKWEKIDERRLQRKNNRCFRCKKLKNKNVYNYFLEAGALGHYN
jgi:hypothetical protein